MEYINPYHKLGLRRNPFISSENLQISPKLWLDFGFSSPPPPANRLFWQVIGEKGAGKTSHLLHWQQQTGGVYYYCSQGWLSWQLPPVNEIAYWDEANRIPFPLLLISLLKARFLNATIAIGTHKSLVKIAILLGFQTQEIKLSTLNIDNLLEWIKKRIKAESLSANTPVLLELTPEQAEKIITKSQGSWRKAANYLHILVAQMANNLG